MSKRHLMLDLETFGKGNNAAIIAIGACTFDLPGEIGDGSDLYYQVIDLEISSHPGDIDGSTVLWWLKQEADARNALTAPDNTEPLGAALKQFADWVKEMKIETLWSNDPTFDEVILKSAYQRYSLEFPFNFRATRCVRTIRDLPNAPRLYMEKGTSHNALDDAIHQAEHIQLIYQELGL